MTTYNAGALAQPVVPIGVNPSGLSCSARIALAVDVTGTNIVAQSNVINFNSSGSIEAIAFNLTMPATPGSYYAFTIVIIGGIQYVVRDANQIIVVAAALYDYEISGRCDVENDAVVITLKNNNLIATAPFIFMCMLRGYDPESGNYIDFHGGNNYWFPIPQPGDSLAFSFPSYRVINGQPALQEVKIGAWGPPDYGIRLSRYNSNSTVEPSENYTPVHPFPAVTLGPNGPI